MTRNLGISMSSSRPRPRPHGMPAEPGLGLARLGGYGQPGPALSSAADDVVGDAGVAEVSRDLVRSLAGGMALSRVAGMSQSVPAQRGPDGMVRETELGRDGVHGPVLLQVPVSQVARHVGEPEFAQHRKPASVGP